MQQKEEKTVERLSQVGGSEEIGREPGRRRAGTENIWRGSADTCSYACHLAVDVAVTNRLLQSGQ